MFDAVSSKIDFSAMEEEVLAFWAGNRTFERSVEQRTGRPEFVFYDGPPFATGLPHYGHLLAGTIKDIVPRYQAMRGFRVERRFGWDCHGLPIEALAQEALGLAGAPAIQAAGVDVFNEQCRSMVSTYVEEWEKTVTRMGRWVDFKNDYKTMDPSFMETIWWVFSELWKQGRIYRAHRIMPYSWKLNTPLSNFEAGRNYQEVQDPAVTVRVRLKGFSGKNTWALLWTTTPWTLPSNLAICAHPEMDYVEVRDAATGDHYLLAECRLTAVYPSGEEVEVVRRMKGTELDGVAYEPLFPYFEDHPGAFRMLLDPFVTGEEGTGIVHLAPAYGEDDYRICREAGIELVDPLDSECRFTAQVPDWEGLFCKEADKAIIRRLKEEGRLVHQSTTQHSYPFCERTDTPLIYRAISAWYVRVEDLREAMRENNAQVHWVPAHVGEKRFANWLAEARDWNISRNRFWGSCIPVWICEDEPEEMICVGSLDELEALCGERPADLHKHTLDRIVIHRDGKTYRRTPEVLDCWFESGAMPYAQHHYPFENKAHFEANFPAHFIAEGLDQTRGWFYTLMVLSTALFGKPAFRNVVVNGLVLAEDGFKMSKRLKNYPDPLEVVHSYGADALRLYLIHSPVVRAESLRFSEEGVKHALRHLLIPLWNAYSFFVTYARIDGWTPASGRPEGGRRELLDRWIESSLAALCQEVTAAMDDYDLQRAVRPFVAFIEDLTNWYIRRSRRRFWKSDDDADKQQAYATLYHVLIDLCKIAAPFTPFIAEAIYRNLRGEEMPESVHLCDFPLGAADQHDPDLEQQMRIVMEVVGMGRQIRKDHGVKVRQPLRRLDVVSRDSELLNRVGELKQIIADELNVHEVVFSGDESGFAELRAKADFKALGPRFGKEVQSVNRAVQALPAEVLRGLEPEGEVALDLGDRTVEIPAAEIRIERIPREGMAVQAQGALVAALELELDDALIREGLARELVNNIQQLRKTTGLEVTDRIRVRLCTDRAVEEAVEAFRETIAGEVLATAIELGDTEGTKVDLNGHACVVHIERQPSG